MKTIKTECKTPIAAVNRRRRLRSVASVAIFAAIAFFLLTRVQNRDETTAPITTPLNVAEAKAKPESTEGALIGYLFTTAGVARPAPNPEVRRDDQLLEELKALFAALSGMERGAAVRLLTEFLRSGKDARLPFVFGVAKGGLVSHPTSMRVAILDFLGRLDAQVAKELAREIFGSSTSADEWAVSLRNYAWAIERKSDDAYRSVVKSYLSNSDWLAHPSAGYLHGFDAATVLTGSAEVSSSLVTLASYGHHDAVRYAAYLTLDRLAVTDTTTVLSSLASDKNALNDQPERRARLFARADTTDQAQLAILNLYLAELTNSNEAHQFASRFPNFDSFSYPSLVSETSVPKRGDIVRQDADALVKTEAWLAAAPSSVIAPYLESLRAKLAAFQESARVGDNEPYQPINFITLPK
jgi:hypothetical protein